MNAPLYNLDILRLASLVGEHPRLDAPDASVERRSVVCGSRVVVDTMVDDHGIVTAFGMEVRACALGQAAAALLGASIVGRTAEDVEHARATLTAFLAGASDSVGDWPGIAILEAARDYPARHPSIRLAFEAAAEAAAKVSAR